MSTPQPPHVPGQPGASEPQPGWGNPATPQTPHNPAQQNTPAPQTPATPQGYPSQQAVPAASQDGWGQASQPVAPAQQAPTGQDGWSREAQQNAPTAAATNASQQGSQNGWGQAAAAPAQGSAEHNGPAQNAGWGNQASSPDAAGSAQQGGSTQQGGWGNQAAASGPAQQGGTAQQGGWGNPVASNNSAGSGAPANHGAAGAYAAAGQAAGYQQNGAGPSGGYPAGPQGGGNGNGMPPLGPDGQPLAQGPSPRRRGRVIAWTAGGVAAAVVAAGFGVPAIIAQASQRGADSAQAAIERLDTGFREKNMTEVAKLLAPSEVRPFFENMKALGVDSGLDKLQSHSKVPFGEMDVEGMQQVLDSITITSSDMEFTVSEKSNTIAMAELQSWKLNTSVDKAKLVDAVINMQERAGLKDTATMREQMDDALKNSNLAFNGDVVKEADGKLSIALVKEKDRWYFSPVMSIAEAAFRSSNSDASPRYDANVEGAAGKGSPSEAVQALLDQTASISGPEDLLKDEYTSLLALPERRALMVYGPAMTDGEPKVDGGNGRTEFFKAEWKLSEHKINDDLAIVGPGQSKIIPNGDSSSEITFDGAKVTADGDTVDFGKSLTNPQRLGLATVRENGTWHVSTLDTLSNFVTLRGNDQGIETAKKFIESMGDTSGLKWDDLDERTRAMLGGVLFFVDPIEQISGESLFDAVEGLGEPDFSSDSGYSDSSGTEYGAEGSTGLGSRDVYGSDLEADLSKLFGSNG